MKYCSKCGKPIEDGNQFCAHCGTKMIETVPVQSQPKPQPQPQPQPQPKPQPKPQPQPQAAVSTPAPAAKSSNKKPVVVLSIVCGLLVVLLVVLFFVFIFPNLNNSNESNDVSTVTHTTTFTDNTFGYDDTVVSPTRVTTTRETTTRTTTTRATTTTAPKNLSPVQSHDKTYRVRLTQGVNVRTGAYAEAQIIGSLQKETIVSSTAIQGDWVYVQYGALEGWVHLSGIVEVTNQLMTPDSSAYSVMRNGRVTTRDGDGVNLRYGPSTGFDIIQPILERQIVYVMYSQDGWYYVEYNGVYGWASSEFVYLM